MQRFRKQQSSGTTVFLTSLLLLLLLSAATDDDGGGSVPRVSKYSRAMQEEAQKSKTFEQYTIGSLRLFHCFLFLTALEGTKQTWTALRIRERRFSRHASLPLLFLGHSYRCRAQFAKETDHIDAKKKKLDADGDDDDDDDDIDFDEEIK